MRVLLIKRGPDTKPQVVGEFVWENGSVVTVERAVPNAQVILEGLRPEIDDTSEAAARASMQKMARRYAGGYFWARYES